MRFREQDLGRVLVAAVTRVDDRTVDLLGEEMNGTRFGVADDRTSGCIAFKVIAVSIRVSPLTIELAGTDMLMTSPPSRLPATSNEVRVRVELSKKQLMIVRPRNRLRFFSASRFNST
jgi:hypothetical protein